MKNRKTIALIALIWVCGFSARTHAQVDVTFNPLGFLLFSDIHFGVDFGINKNVSLEGSVGYQFDSENNSNMKWRAIPATAAFKYYFVPKRGADRLYTDLFLQYASRYYTADEGGSQFAEYKRMRFGIGFGLGYKAVSRGGAVFDFGAGLSRALYDEIKFTRPGDEYKFVWPKLLVTLKLGIGYRFGHKGE